MRVSRGASFLRLTPLHFVAFFAFVTLGFPDGMMGVAWPSMSGTFVREIGNLGILVFAGAGGYFVLTLLTGSISRLMPFPTMFLAAIGAMFVGAAGIAVAPSWGILLIAAIALGAGGGLLDGGLNAYAATRFRPRDLNWLHACYGVGATVGPLVMTWFVTSGIVWRYGYAVLVVLLLSLLAVMVAFRRRWDTTRVGRRANIEAAATRTSDQDHADRGAPLGEVTQLDSRRGGLNDDAIPVGISRGRYVMIIVASVLTFLVYTGAEAIAGQWSFTLFTIGRGVREGLAGAWVTAYYAALTVGRILFGWIAERVGSMRLLRITVGSAAAGALMIAVSGAGISQWVGAAGLVILGGSLAPMFPLLIGLTPRRVGTRAVNHVVGFQIAAASVGVFGLSGATGLLVSRSGIESVGWVVLGCAVAVGLFNELVERLRRT
jgi:fucose permease